jgi:hypothetical protein
MKSLFDLCLTQLARHLPAHLPSLPHLPVRCRERILEWLVSHDRIMSGQTQQLVQNAAFTQSLSEISFYLSDELTDDWLALLMTQHNLVLTKISLVYCSQISDRGVMCLTNGKVVVI